MIINKLLKIITLALGVAYVTVQAMELEHIGLGLSSLALILILILYYRVVKEKKKFFFAFLVCFTVSHISGFISYFFILDYNDIDYMYYIGNLLYILSYAFLIFQILYPLNFRTIISKFAVSIFILLVLDIFAVTLVTETAQSALEISEYVMEFFYNAVIMVLLSVALINYMYRDDNKSMLFLVGSIFIFFSEIIMLADFYIAQSQYLSATYSAFLVMAFLFLYLQSRLQHTGPVEEYVEEGISA
ncbi:hypothetical protein Q2T40_08880 [Winogradskyella maritima]|uniref:YhhN-like protein n=1 Tax=Winogradskyella maritima TaxID=1517766 RepID=A0ABV8AGS1_9FLAO|nr:hypothetical protein [Winogradskyella maritima]